MDDEQANESQVQLKVRPNQADRRTQIRNLFRQMTTHRTVSETRMMTTY